MNNTSKIEHEINEKKTNHTLYSNEDSKNLVVFFPGGSNSLDRPFLNYLKDYFLENSYDVLHISYENIFKREETLDVKTEKLILWINEAIKSVNSDKKYNKMSFVSRSFGNLLSCEIKIRNSLLVEKSIYISPITETIKYFEKYPGYIVSASNDEYLTSEDITYLSTQIDKNIIIFKDGGHNLHTEDEFKTNDFYRQAFKSIVHFINE
ncbi:MAG: hypothetical protein KAU02_03420 [Tenericutes bacterium]|nr:hypothetical protein [Mycoplasmatota bacterium]